MIPVFSEHTLHQIKAVENLILSEVNVKAVDYITDDSEILVKKIKANFKTLGPKFGKLMKQLAAKIQNINQDGIKELEQNGSYLLTVMDKDVEITLDDVEISTQDIPGWSVFSDGKLTVALDINVTPALKEEGIAREFVNRIQNMRKDRGFDVTDRINLIVEKNSITNNAFVNFNEYICSETLSTLSVVDKLNNEDAIGVELLEGVSVLLIINKQ
jgi:isoleucyl-tRNA synthetase